MKKYGLDNWLFLASSDTEEEGEQKIKGMQTRTNGRQNALVRVVMAGRRDLSSGAEHLEREGN